MSKPCNRCFGTAMCNLCNKCIEAHCVCKNFTLDRNCTSCRESRPCNCVSQDLRCSICFGCRSNEYNLNFSASHCRCDAHKLLKCLCFKSDVSVNQRVKKNDIANINVCWRKGIPSCVDMYKVQQPSQASVFESRQLYQVVLRHNDAKEQWDLRDGPKIYAKGSSYLDTLNVDTSLGIMKQGLRSKVNSYIFRALENMEFRWNQQENMPLDELVDYIIFMASLKATSVPELVGKFETSAAIATAIVVEEYVKQSIESFITNNYECPIQEECEVQEYIQELLLGTDLNSIHEADECVLRKIMEEVFLVFGDKVQKYDTEKLINAMLQNLKLKSSPPMLTDAETTRKRKIWEIREIERGFAQLLKGKEVSMHGIRVIRDTKHGYPSYYFQCGRLTQVQELHNYRSYEEAFYAKLEFEELVSFRRSSKLAKPSAAPKYIISIPDSDNEDSCDETKQENHFTQNNRSDASERTTRLNIPDPEKLFDWNLKLIVNSIASTIPIIYDCELQNVSAQRDDNDSDDYVP